MLHPAAIKPDLIRSILQLVSFGGFALARRRPGSQPVSNGHRPPSILDPQQVYPLPSTLQRCGRAIGFLGFAGFLLMFIWKG